MSSVRVQKLFEAMPEQIKRVGGYSVNFKEVLRWLGRATAGTYVGQDACVIDFDALAWADNARRAIIVAEPAADLNNTASMKTQSHAMGYFLDGSVRFHLFMETPEALTNAQAKWQREVLHHLMGQLGAPVQLWYCANDTEPTIEGVNGAVATAAFTSAGWYLPWGMTYPGGV
jgi:hypothetical protein